MILYEYRCIACRTLFTARRPMETRNDPAACPECGRAGRRVISVPQKWDAAWSTPRDPEELRKADELWGK